MPQDVQTEAERRAQVTIVDCESKNETESNGKADSTGEPDAVI